MQPFTFCFNENIQLLPDARDKWLLYLFNDVIVLSLVLNSAQNLLRLCKWNELAKVTLFHAWGDRRGNCAQWFLTGSDSPAHLHMRPAVPPTAVVLLRLPSNAHQNVVHTSVPIITLRAKILFDHSPWNRQLEQLLFSLNTSPPAIHADKVEVEAGNNTKCAHWGRKKITRSKKSSFSLRWKNRLMVHLTHIDMNAIAIDFLLTL